VGRKKTKTDVYSTFVRLAEFLDIRTPREVVFNADSMSDALILLEGHVIPVIVDGDMIWAR